MKISYLTRICSFLIAVGLAFPAYSMNEQQLLALTSAVKEMCETPTKSGEKFEIEGTASGGAIIKAIGASLEGTISKETWEGIEQIRETQADRLNCVTQVLGILAPSMKETKAKVCRDKSHGVERYQRVFEVTRDSSWMGGGFDPTKWCNQVIQGLRGEHPDGKFEVVRKSERSESKCKPFNCPQYLYFCTVRVHTDPLYIEKESSACL